MRRVWPVRASGSEALSLVIQLLHRVRLSDGRAGVWEAADLAWWTRRPRRSDEIEQLFWMDGEGPVAAAMLTDWTRTWGLDVITLPGLPIELRTNAWVAGVEAVEDLRLEAVESLIRDDDVELARLATAAGFEPTADRNGEAWMEASDRPLREDLADGFELGDRRRFGDGRHWLAARNGPAVEDRLESLSLYDPSLDLSIRAPTGEIAAYALFWFDPLTGIGLLEPMRTEDAWQRRGLARHLIAAGLERLAARGAMRFKVGYTTDAALALYSGAGFRAGAAMTAYSRRPRS